jgi:hypothetical protein
MSLAIPDRIAVYVVYQVKTGSAKRETVGWLTKETGSSVCIQNDRTLETSKTSSGSGNATLIPLSWIQEIRVLEKGEKIDPGSLFNIRLS